MTKVPLPVTPPRTALAQLWALREDAGFRPGGDGPGAGVVTTPWGDVPLDTESPVVARALERMTYGPVSLDNIAPGFGDIVANHPDTAPAAAGRPDGQAPEPGPKQHSATGRPSDHAALRAVLAALQHTVVRTLATPDGNHVLTVVPMSRRATFAPVPPADDTVHRLSRFVTLRTGPEGWLAESPLSPHRVTLHSPRASLLVSCYTRARTVIEVARLLGQPTAETALVVAHLAAAGILVPGIVRPGTATPVTFAEDHEPLTHWSPRELLVHQRSRPGAHDEPVGRIGEFRTDEGGPTGLARRGPAIALPIPDPELIRASDPSLSEAMAARRSVRLDDGQPLTIQELGQLLHRSAGVRPNNGRPYPSIGSRYPLELYLTVTGGGELRRGVYHYDPYAHTLTPLDTPPELVDRLLVEAGVNAGLSKEPPVLISMTARYHRLSASYRGTAYSALLKEVGAFQQTLYLVATAMGLGPCALAFGDTETAAHAFGLDWLVEPGVGEFVVSAFPESAAHPRR
ncbi:SagB family peptide dehydrogenase [Streptomyces sp. ST2-7A]|uniref:SagB family peptide dehydrogenase n=1 Tax=Streptomyces sp. ST2-7A TaxID=2907214 RepID=UPI001F397674|nr:SagB family peptide dehydrogenase [Streptomyces sp. ST2-7A]MCE7082360.1 SagB family peptide dehydrogenase [Streptomyces sp. ST2-7A]